MELKLYGNAIFVYRQPIDFRLGIDGLTQLVSSQLKRNPQQGVCLFYNRSRDRLKGLCWHKNGFVLFCKRLEKGKFIFSFNEHQGVMEIKAAQMGWLLAGFDWQAMDRWPELDFDTFT